MIKIAKDIAKKVLEVDSGVFEYLDLENNNTTVDVSIYNDRYYILLKNDAKIPTYFTPKERLEFINTGKVFYQAGIGPKGIFVVHQETSKDSFNHNKRMFDKGEKFKFNCDELFMCNAEIFIMEIT